MTAREMLPEQLAEMRAFYDGDDGEIGDLLDHVDALTAKLATAERERDEARHFLGLQHAMVASGHSHSLLRHEHQCTVDAMQGIEVREREAVSRAKRTEARAEAAEAKLRALDAWAGEVLATLDDAAVVDVYGYPESGDPRLFTPDPGSCTPEEIAAHAAALAAVEAGAEPADLPATWTQDGERVVHMHRSPWGIGTYRWTDEDAAERRDRLAAALRAARGGE